ncbi:hypothetical protein HMPREF1139_1998 [Campylobacter sp. FOBRC14]|nr:hypothetical protein HMPREF1139_1998 [Campylobacter sp. FOBRC14]
MIRGVQANYSKRFYFVKDGYIYVSLGLFSYVVDVVAR